MLTAKQQVIVTNIESDSFWIDGDQFRLTQVLVNLISNASKFSEIQGTIRMNVRADDDDVEIDISDDGIGIDPHDLPSIFDFFAQSQSADSLDHSSGGLGIGLGLVKGIVEMHDGSVTAHSDGNGKGSRFAVRLPVCEPIKKSDSHDPPSITPTRRRVMIVDDRRENEFILNALVRKLGEHETRSARDGSAALDCLKEFQPDLILLDLGLPGMSGLELAREIRKLNHCRDTVIVALTGYDDSEMRQQAESAGIDLYRLKPASMDMLKEVFQRLNVLKSPKVADDAHSLPR